MTQSVLKTLLVGTLLLPTAGIQAQARTTNNTLSTLAGLGTVAAIAYGTHWIVCKYIYYRANTRYEMPTAVVAALGDNPNDHASLYQELLGFVNIDNVNYCSPTSPYYHYPLLSFVEDLDWYIKRLARGSWFTMPTPLSADAHALKQQLQRVRYFCVRHPAYIEQRKKANYDKTLTGCADKVVHTVHSTQ